MVPTGLVPGIWNQHRHSVALALDRGNVGTSIEAVERWLFSGEAQLWLTRHGVGVTQLTKQDGQMLCTLVAFTGDYPKCKQNLATLEQFAREVGCERFMVLGRKGWARRLPDYRSPYIVLEKSL
jgi:hypothetical protein